MEDHTKARFVSDLVLYEKGAMAFKDKAIPESELLEILETIRPYAGFAKWRLVYVKDRTKRIRVVEAWQGGLKKIGQERGAQFIERWKQAPLLLAFYMPKKTEPFQWVPSEFVRTLALVELGVALHGLMLVARAHGVETHWITGALVVSEQINQVLEVPDDYELVFFVVAGYPSEEIVQKFPPLEEVCFADTWGRTPELRDRTKHSL